MSNTAKDRINCILGLCILLATAGCASGPSADPKYDLYQTADADGPRDVAAAEKALANGLAQVDAGELEAAEQTLREALTHDVMLGSAHNALGLVYYRQDKLYEAAWEFQYAAKLMPNRAEPLNNLGLVFERVGKWDDAIRTYETALDREPDNIEIVGNMTRARYRTGERSEQLRALLEQIQDQDRRPEWIEWSRQSLSELPR